MKQFDLQKALTALVHATRPGAGPIDMALAAQKEIAALAPAVDRPTLNLGLSQLTEALAEPDVEHPAVLALGCLALVEQGGNPRIPLDPLLRKVRRALRQARDFVRMCRRAARTADPAIPDEEAIEQFGPELLQSHPEESWSWRGLPYLCQCACALLNQTPQAAPRLKAHPEILPECTHLLTECPDLLPPPVHDLRGLIEALSDARAAVSAMLDPESPGALAVAGCKFFEYSATTLEPAVRDEALQRLAAGLVDPRLIFPALLTRTAEVLVETGGNPELVFQPFIERLSIVLDQALAFVDACRVEAQNDDEEPDDERYIAEAMGRVRQRHPIEAFAWTGLGSMCQSLLTFVAACPQARARARTHPRLLSQINELEQVREWTELQHLRFLHMALRVLDDAELLVLHPQQQKGFRLRLGGVLTLGQLNILLAGALLGDPAAGWLEGEPVDAQAVAAARDQPLNADLGRVTCRFDLIAWHGLRAEGVIDLQNLLFASDVPADIPLFKGERVLLLREPWTKQQWNPNRALERMPAWLTVTEQLAPAEVASWLARLQHTAVPEE